MCLWGFKSSWWHLHRLIFGSTLPWSPTDSHSSICQMEWVLTLIITLPETNVAMEIHHFDGFPKKVGIFHGYVTVPEGKLLQDWSGFNKDMPEMTSITTQQMTTALKSTFQTSNYCIYCSKILRKNWLPSRFHNDILESPLTKMTFLVLVHRNSSFFCAAITTMSGSETWKSKFGRRQLQMSRQVIDLVFVGFWTLKVDLQNAITFQVSHFRVGFVWKI